MAGCSILRNHSIKGSRVVSERGGDGERGKGWNREGGVTGEQFDEEMKGEKVFRRGGEGKGGHMEENGRWWGGFKERLKQNEGDRR